MKITDGKRVLLALGFYYRTASLGGIVFLFQIQKKRKDLRLIVASATLNAEVSSLVCPPCHLSELDLLETFTVFVDWLLLLSVNLFSLSGSVCYL